MINVICSAIRYEQPLYFECKGHATYRNIETGYNDLCAECSTLCSMLVRYIDSQGYEPAICEDGHVKINIDHSDMKIKEVFSAAMLEFKHLAVHFPEHIKVY